MKTAAAAHEDGLAFAWHDRHVFSLVLPGFLLGSFVLHALAFYVLQVKYPPAASAIPPPAAIRLLLPTPENEEVRRWIDAEDPAIGLAPESMPFLSMFEVPYRPSFAEGRAQPHLPEWNPPPVAYPPARPVLEAMAAPAGGAPPPVPAKSSSATSLLFSDELMARRTGRPAPRLVPAQRSPTAAGSSRYFLGVAPDGTVRFIFLEAGSGSDVLDAEGEKLLVALPFVPVDGPLTWGFATLTWGAEAFVPPPEDGH